MGTPKALATLSAVMSSYRADAACRQKIRVAVAQRVDCGNDFGFHVRNDPHLAQIYPDVGQIFRDIADILVLGAPRQDLIADHENGSGNGGGHARQSF